jgi:glycosyltransferase involved in cell wall biosynthesis
MIGHLKKKKRILIFSQYYLPGYKSGGGMRTIVNIVANLKDRFDFFIITSDHDGPSDRTPYKNVKLNDWNEVEGAQVFYLSGIRTVYSKIPELIRAVGPDIIYSNSYFSIFNIYLLILNRLNKFKGITYLISPCGELSDGALKLSYYKKKVFIFAAKLLGLHRNIFWKATTELEKREIERLGIETGRIYIAPDLTARPASLKGEHRKLEKKEGSVKFVFLSRFSRKKNFKYFLEKLLQAKGNIEVDIYAPVDDEKYWNECAEMIEKMPPHIRVQKKPPVPHPEVHAVLGRYHFFVLPTLGENFGHVFLEALAAGCPILISDRTPWRGLAEKKIGRDLPLEDDTSWEKAIAECVSMPQEEYDLWSANARKFALKWLEENDADKLTLELLEKI